MSEALKTSGHIIPPIQAVVPGTVQDARHESDAILRSFYDSAPMMMGVVEVLEDDILLLSDNAPTARFMGVAPGETRHRLASELGMPQEDIREWIEHYRECAHTHTPVRFEYAHQTAEGEGWLSATVSYIATTAEGRLRCSFMAEDITERKRMEIKQKESENHTRDFFDSITDGLIAYDRQWRIIYANEAAASIYRLPRETLAGQMIWDLFPDEAQSDYAAACRQAMHEPIPIHREDYWSRYHVWIENHILPIRDGIVVMFRDITQRKRDEATLHFLAEASALLASSLDYETTLANVAKIAVPHLADWCAVHILQEDGSSRQLAVAHVNPEKLKWAQELQQRYPYDPESTHGVANVLRTGQPEFYPDIPDEMLVAASRDEEHLRIMREVGLTSALIVPMKARGRTLGAITFVSAESKRPYTQADLIVAENLAYKAALAVENAHLYRAEKERSEQLALAVREVHHRVKNSLNCVSALLEMQIPPGSDTVSVEAVHDSLGQIKTIALVHDLLARDQPIGNVNIARVLTNLVSLMNAERHGGKNDLPIQLEVEPVWLPTKAATALALIVNELAANAYKHGRVPAKQKSKSLTTIKVGLYRHQGNVCVTVQDAGPGFPPEFDPSRHANIGLELVLSLVAIDLQGTIRFSIAGDPDLDALSRGARVEITFPEDLLSE